jgi:hypothetical protein
MSGAKVALATAVALATLLAGAAWAAVASHLTPAGLALAHQALLRRADLGQGWTGTPAPKAVPELTCPGFRPGLKGVVEAGAASSPTFRASSSGPFASDTAYAYATAAEEATVWRTIARPGLLSCVAESLTAASGDGVHFTVIGKDLLALANLPARAAGYRVAGTASTANQTVDVYLDVLLLGRGETVTELSISSFEQPVARSFELWLARIIARRMGP